MQLGNRLDRLVRSLLKSAVLLEELRQHGVRLVIVTAPELGNAAGDNFMLNILASFAEFEREMIASRIAESRARLKARGVRVGGAVPLGYSTDPRTKQLVANKDDATIVKWMFAQAGSGQAPAKIADQANERGWLTKVRVGIRPARKQGGNPWTARQVVATLRNPVYIGIFQERGSRRAGFHDAIIATELFESVGAQLDSRRTRVPGKGFLGIVWHLRGLVRCGICDRFMATHTVRKRNCIYLYYRCRSTAGGLKPCGVQVGAAQLEFAVLRELSIRSDPDADVFKKLVETLSYDHRSGIITMTLVPPSESPPEQQALP
jgi:site-specific DNA recombinase